MATKPANQRRKNLRLILSKALNVCKMVDREMKDEDHGIVGQVTRKLGHGTGEYLRHWKKGGFIAEYETPGAQPERYEITVKRKK